MHFLNQAGVPILLPILQMKRLRLTEGEALVQSQDPGIRDKARLWTFPLGPS